MFQIAILLLGLVAAARGGVLYHRHHGDQVVPQQNYLDDNVRLVKITRTVAVPVPYQLPLQVPLSQEVPLVLSSSPQFVSVVPRLALIPQHYQQGYVPQGYLPLHQVQATQPRQAAKSEAKPAYSRQQHEQFHLGRQQQ